MTEHAKDPLAAFKNWFDSVWFGDGEHGHEIPKPTDKNYSEYLEKYALAYGGFLEGAKFQEQFKYKTLFEQAEKIKKLSEEIAELKNVVNAFKDAYVDLTNSEVHLDSGIVHIANFQLMDKFDAAFDLIKPE